jgi:hypothetical protein
MQFIARYGGVIEGVCFVADLLVCLVSFAGYDHGVSAFGDTQRQADGRSAVRLDVIVRANAF